MAQEDTLLRAVLDRPDDDPPRLAFADYMEEIRDPRAEVIRVDRRQGSEDRYIGPVADDGHGGHYLSLNRNKRSLTLDVSKPQSVQIIERLARGTDVVIANLPVAVLKKMRIDPALSAGVILTTFTDCIGFATLLGLGTLFLT